MPERRDDTNAVRRKTQKIEEKEKEEAKEIQAGI